jgi:hypothetical protein
MQKVYKVILAIVVTYTIYSHVKYIFFQLYPDIYNQIGIWRSIIVFPLSVFVFGLVAGPVIAAISAIFDSERLKSIKEFFTYILFLAGSYLASFLLALWIGLLIWILYKVF